MARENRSEHATNAALAEKQARQCEREYKLALRRAERCAKWGAWDTGAQHIAYALRMRDRAAQLRALFLA